MSAPDDQRLVRAAREGDRHAFACLVARHYPRLLTSCEWMLAERDLARDAAQEATLRALLGLDQLRDADRFGSWLIGIGLNVCRGLLNVRRRQLSLDALQDAGRLPEPASDGPEPLELVTAAELAERVRAAIGELPAGQRRAVALFYLEGLTQAEAAEELGTGPGAIKTRLHKARTSLRATLIDTYKEYIEMPDEAPQLIPVRVAELRRTRPVSGGLARHIVVLEDDRGRRLPIWVGEPEATALALILERVQMPRPGVYQFAASLLSAAGGRLREVRITELTDSTFYAQAILADETPIDSRPSDALTLALLAEAPIYINERLLTRAGAAHDELIDGAGEVVGDARTMAADARRRYEATLASLTRADD